MHIWVFKNHPRKGVFHNVNLSYLVNVLQRNLSTRRAGECIFRPSGGTNYENFPVQCQPWWRLPELDLCNDLPKNSGTSLPGMLRFWISKVTQGISIFVNLTGLSMPQDAIMEELWIFQDSEYTRFLYMQTLHKVLNVSEYGWIMLR